MSINTVKRGLRSLPYTEMKALAKQVAEDLGPMMEEIGEGDDWPTIVADTLSQLPLEADVSLEDENVFLARALTTKRKGKKEIVLKPNGSAWVAQLGDFVATALTVRGAVSELLDQIAGYEALTGTELREMGK